MSLAGESERAAPALQFPQLDRQVHARAGESVFQAARRQGVRIVGACGGRGTCGTCAVHVTTGEVEPCGAHAEVDGADGRKWVRACQVHPRGDCSIEVARRSLAPIARAEVDVAGEHVLELAPLVTSLDVRVAPANLADTTADAERVLEALGRDAVFDLHALRELPGCLRARDWQVRVHLRGRDIIAVAPPGRRALGLAVDLGTTNAAGFLLDLQTGQRLAGLGIENPQGAWGADLISRIDHACRSPAGAGELREAAVAAIDALAADLCRAVGAQPAEVLDVAVCGNTAMQHLLLGLPIRQLGRAPFVAAASGALDVRAREAGVAVNAGAWIHVAPAIGGFVGGDHVAALLATEPQWRFQRTALVIDIGTNTEISLIHDGVIRSASSPSGPALEGGHIGCGMRAADGAIERVRLERDGGFAVTTLGEGPPVGICGSGVLDAVAACQRARVIDARGRMQRSHPAVATHQGQLAARLAADVYFTQADVRAVQLAKAAIRTALDLLLDEAGVDSSAIGLCLIAGSFGAYIDVGSAVRIGMLPDLPRQRFRQVGNAAGQGVRMLLASGRARQHASELAARCRYLELSSRKDFQQRFLHNIGLGTAPQPAARGVTT